MQMREALFNWVQIRVVWNARPQDRSAEETVQFFEQLLIEDHGMDQITLDWEEDHYVVRWTQNGQEATHTFFQTEAEALLKSIEAEPKYHQVGEVPKKERRK